MKIFFIFVQIYWQTLLGAKKNDNLLKIGVPDCPKKPLDHLEDTDRLYRHKIII